LVLDAATDSTSLTANAFTQIDNHGVAFTDLAFTVWFIVVSDHRACCGCANSGDRNQRSACGNGTEKTAFGGIHNSPAKID
jgi:hypothetical protein